MQAARATRPLHRLFRQTVRGYNTSGSEIIVTPPRSRIRAPQDEAPTLQESFQKFLRQPRDAPPHDSAKLVLRRIGKCLAFGCNEKQTAEAARLVRTITANWPRLQMSRSNAATDPSAVAYDRIDLHKRDASWEPEVRDWGGIPKHSPPTRIAEMTVLRYLDYAIATAPHAAKEHWLRVKKTQRKLWRIEAHNKYIPPTPLHIRSIKYPVLSIRDKIRSNQDLVAYARLHEIEEFDRRVRFVLNVAIWSLRHLETIAEARVKVVFKPMDGNLRWFLRELERLLDLQSPAGRRELDDIMESVRRLEQETWDREDAVEDFGSA